MIVFDEPGVRLYQGDCLEVMRGLPDASVHAVVTDPPYGLDFMGKGWDNPKMLGQMATGNEQRGAFAYGGTHSRGYATHNGLAFEAWVTEWASECFRLLKPGGHLLAFGGSRTWHRLASGIEDAGFELRDSIAWLYGSGFPKSRDVSAAMAEYIANGPQAVEPSARPVPEGIYEVTGFLRAARDKAGWSNRQIDALFGTNGMSGHWTSSTSQPAVPSERQWEVLKEALGFGDEMDELARRMGSTERPEDWGQGAGDESFLGGLQRDKDAPSAGGWGTALKPAFEPVVVARKPVQGTVAANVLAHGTGALNIDGGRTGTELRGSTRSTGVKVSENASMTGGNYAREAGPDVIGRWPTNVVLDGTQADALDAQTGVTRSPIGPVHQGGRQGFAPGGERGAERDGVGVGYGDSGGASRFFPTFRYEPKAPQHERPKHGEVQHPTVKPVDLMRWLVRLVTPPGGVVLEPFAGSGTTLEAALAEGFDVIGIEREADYIPLIVKRITKPIQQTLLGDWGDAA